MHKSRTSLAGKLFSLLMAMAMVLSLMPTAAFAEGTEDEEKTESTGGTYVLMNIPYGKFYEAEGVEKVDAVSSSTKSKPLGKLAAGSYHIADHNTAANEEVKTVDISGIIYPVYVPDMSVLDSSKEVTDSSDPITITTQGKGGSSTVTYTGKETLFEHPDYSYYVLSEDDTPTAYKELTVNSDGSFSFSAVKNATDISNQATDVKVEMVTGGRHTDYEITLENLPYSAVEVTGDDGKTKTENQLASMVSAVTLTTEEGKVYGLRHVYEIWRGTELGFNADDEVYGKLQGETITEITYYLNNGEVFTVDTELEIPEVPTVTVDNMVVGSTATNVTEALTRNFSAKGVTKTYTVTDADGKTVEDAGVNKGVLTMPKDTSAGTYTLTITAKKNDEVSGEVKTNFVVSEYVLMNIPYDKFYEKELTNNTVKVDAVTSATLNKTRTGTLVGGSYHVNSKGTDITGVTYPVRVTSADAVKDYKQVTDKDSVTITVSNRGKTIETTYSGKDALFENDSYAYYILSEDPSYYKELTVGEDGTPSFGAVTANSTDTETTTLDNVDVTLTTDTNYGDYEIDLPEELNETVGDTVYAVVLKTKDGYGYGLRHLENIWRVYKLAFCTGFTDTVHGNPTSSSHYASIMGKTITDIVYYTEKGIFDIKVSEENGYVPIKNEDYSVKVANGTAGNGSVAVTLTTPEGVDSLTNLTYKVGDDTVTVADGKWTYTNKLPGTYTLTVSDSNGKYADISAEFTLSTDQAAAQYNASSKALVVASGTSANEFKNYLSNITSVSVNGKDYSATGKGSTTIVNKDGSIATDATPFADKGTYTVVVTSAGYPELKFELDLSNSSDTDNTNTNNNSSSSSSSSSSSGSDSGYAEGEGPLANKTEEKNNTSTNTNTNTNTNDTKDDTGFTDVKSSDYYADAVKWAVAKGITSGTSATTFSPSATCTRAQTVTFLWRAAGSPTPTSTENPFTDVSTSDYYYNAVLWAVEQGITSGTSTGTFSPNATVTRGQTVTFLYRAAGSPAVSGSSSFGDVSSDAYYANAVQWAVSEGITSGTGSSTFSPAANCTRGQIVTFLYQANQ